MHRFIVFGLCSALSLAGPVLGARARTAVDHDTWQQITDYAGFPALSQGPGEQTCVATANGAQLVEYIEDLRSDTQAAIWRRDSTRELILGIPGTKGLQDWITDAILVPVPFDIPGVRCPGACLVHLGFQGSWNAIAPAVKRTLRAELARHPGYTTTISGHSLGGALAQLAFVTLSNGPYNVGRVFTYGQPRVGNSDFASFVDGLAGASDASPGSFFRVTHANDGVPHLPPMFLDYQHSRTEYWESGSTPTEQTTYRCAGRESIECSLMAIGLGVNRAHVTYAGFGLSCR